MASGWSGYESSWQWWGEGFTPGYRLFFCLGPLRSSETSLSYLVTDALLTLIAEAHSYKAHGQASKHRQDTLTLLEIPWISVVLQTCCSSAPSPPCPSLGLCASPKAGHCLNVVPPSKPPTGNLGTWGRNQESLGSLCAPGLNWDFHAYSAYHLHSPTEQGDGPGPHLAQAGLCPEQVLTYNTVSSNHWLFLKKPRCSVCSLQSTITPLLQEVHKCLNSLAKGGMSAGVNLYGAQQFSQHGWALLLLGDTDRPCSMSPGDGFPWQCLWATVVWMVWRSLTWVLAAWSNWCPKKINFNKIC